MTPDGIGRRVNEYRQKALEHFPLKLIETTGDEALAKWHELKSSGQGLPVVLGGDDENHAFDNLLTPFGPNGPDFPAPPSVEEILDKAADVRFPGDIIKRRKADTEAILKSLKVNLAEDPNLPLLDIFDANSAVERKPYAPPLGEWPASPEPSMGLSVAYDIVTGKPLRKIYIGLVPTDDWTTIPAYLCWGGWNDCPAAEYHVAAMRAWRDRYGAELIGMSSDTINLRVATKPKTREEALALARDQYIYCNDVIDQGVLTYSALAADLMANDWWYFWWD